MLKAVIKKIFFFLFGTEREKIHLRNEFGEQQKKSCERRFFFPRAEMRHLSRCSLEATKKGLSSTL